MSEKQMTTDDKKNMIRKTKTETQESEAHPPGGEMAAVTALQQQVGNRAVQRLLAQRSGDGGFDLDDDTAGRINSQRSGGQALDTGIQTKMGEATGHDFSGVKVHTDSESHTLNEQLGARAFTTGQDIFFRSGEYNPGSSGGQELLAHEMTHVVQQGTGRVSGGGGKMSVNAPGDVYEQEADSVAKTVTSMETAPGIQRQEEEELAQAKLQRQDDEEIAQAKLQRQEDEEEMAQAKLQRQEEEEELAQPKLQRQEEEEEVAQAKLQREEMPEEEMAA